MAVQNSLAKQPARKMEFGVYLTQNAAKQQINKLLGGQAGTRFISSIVAAVQINPALQECTNPSLLSAALQGEALKLSPSPQLGQFYMVPYKKRAKYGRNGELISPEITEAQFQLGYKGYIQLAERSGNYKKLNAIAIKEGELINWDPLNEEISVQLMEDDVKREATPTAGYYAMFEYTNGFRKVMYWSKKKMAAHAEKYSPAFSMNGGMDSLDKLEHGEIPEKELWKYSSFWFKSFDDMALKTMLRQLIGRWGIMSIEMQQAYDADMTVIHEDGTKDYVENEGDFVDTTTENTRMEEPAIGKYQEQETASENDVTASFFS